MSLIYRMSYNISKIEFFDNFSGLLPNHFFINLELHVLVQGFFLGQAIKAVNQHFDQLFLYY